MIYIITLKITPIGENDLLLISQKTFSTQPWIGYIIVVALLLVVVLVVLFSSKSKAPLEEDWEEEEI